MVRRHDLRVAIADMRGLMRDDSCQLVVIQLLEQPARHRDQPAVAGGANCQRIGLCDVDQSELRLPQSRRDGDRFSNAQEALFLGIDCGARHNDLHVQLLLNMLQMPR